ncbi:MAG: hypothetical protein QGG64_14155 [Candidatus Latescibacteria bacterium]|nr:hypothetical protein [Candidatus Latescibacterota bacterium]
MTAREYLESIMPTREMVDHFVTPHDASENVPEELASIMCNNAKSAFDPEIGWVVCDGLRGGSVDGSKGFYLYDEDGARHVVNYPDRECRVHTYGNSFTHCDQVSNGETWQEYLAAHLLEPVRNYGVGGHSVYQAYRRMLIVEKEHPAEYVILNVWDDDHFRNLDAWRSIRMGRQGRFTLPHLRVNLENGTCEEHENLCKTAEEMYRLCDSEWVWDTFGDDPILHATMGRKGSVEDASAMAQSMGGDLANAESDAEVYSLHTEAALFATRFVIEKAEEFTKANGKKLLVLLSFGSRSVTNALEGRPLFDQTFLDWLGTKDVPVIDLRDAYREEYARSKVDVKTFLEPYYIGHHTPLGNFFFAWAIKDRIVEWLDPKPLPYR